MCQPGRLESIGKLTGRPCGAGWLLGFFVNGGLLSLWEMDAGDGQLEADVGVWVWGLAGADELEGVFGGWNLWEMKPCPRSPRQSHAGDVRQRPA